jgi:hypothetical protein
MLLHSFLSGQPAQRCGYIFQHSLWLGALSALWVGFLNLLLVRANLSTPPHLSSAGIGLLTVAYLAAVAGWAFRLWQHFKVQPS